MFLKEECGESIKGRFCANGSDWTKQDLTPPTIMMESVFLTAMVEVHEGQKVAFFDIPGAFLHANSDKDITMVLKGHLAELMV